MFMPGEPMLPEHKLRALSIEIHFLHKEIVARSRKGEICYTAKVIKVVGFVNVFPIDKIYLAFDNVVNGKIFNVDVVNPSLMRLWSLWHATNPLLRNEEVSFLDPYMMHSGNADSNKGQCVMANYLHKIILQSPRHKHNFVCLTSKRKFIPL